MDALSLQALGGRVLVHADSPGDAFEITEDGRVVIGRESTKYPEAELQVEGQIIAQEVRVTVEGWADDVFEPDYQLTPLSEVRESIDTRGHLPGVPSAADVRRDGVDVGAMNATLLRKVEELTLHAIEQEERLRRLEAGVAKCGPGGAP